MEKLWTTAEVAKFLGVAEHDVEALVKAGRLTGYRLGGQFLRFRPEQVHALKGHVQPSAAAATPAPRAETAGDRIAEFFYFYDFYLVSALLLVFLIGYLLVAG